MLGSALAKAKKPAEKPADHTLAEFAGNYGGSVWGGEMAIRVWGDRLAVVELPSEGLDDIVKLKRQAGDVFVRLTDQDEPRETWTFNRDASGNVVSYTHFSQISPRL